MAIGHQYLFLNNPERCEGRDGTSGLQHQLSYNTAYINSKYIAAIIHLQDPEARYLSSLCLQLSFAFLTVTSALITCWYRKLGGAKVCDKSDCWNLVCKSVHRLF